jgi:hypothetical protein
VFIGMGLGGGEAICDELEKNVDGHVHDLF